MIAGLPSLFDPQPRAALAVPAVLVPKPLRLDPGVGRWPICRKNISFPCARAPTVTLLPSLVGDNVASLTIGALRCGLYALLSRAPP